MTTLPRFISSSETLSGASWRRSSHSTAANNCVEAARLPSGLTAVRDSKDVSGPALLFAPRAWADFLRELAEDGPLGAVGRPLSAVGPSRR
ncbi:protein of unknown function [Actinacidiphila yanglinensis]|uniref:DUF397 domain-containing protein n=1 Tax=Actinacidiphila yanglinensis TaxID=310779 RepID=A0A1H6CCU7_9ACTN|nr:DUF397 domain-containing protein [Actinacidiphila yanglinensis]SEG70692.1 protein of unknown function [Actinacidiphila yanglinensis]